MLTLRFASGTVELAGVASDFELASPCVYDERTHCHRAPAAAYAEIVRELVASKIPFDDQARGYDKLELACRVVREARPFQTEALLAWQKTRARGVVVLPTGAGKSHVAILGIADRQRSTLVVAPTLDLVRQWYDLLRATFGTSIGIVGGGEYDVKPLTVTTYDSAYLHMDHLGARFGLVIFDECHHLPSEAFTFAARSCLAPYRLGLTATPERADGREALFSELIGPICYRREIVELSGEYLSEYHTERVTVGLSEEERAEYEKERSIYLAFVRRHGIRFGSPQGFNEFIMHAARGAEGQQAMQSYRRQRELALAAPAKLDYLEVLLDEHRRDQMLIFTEDNDTAYKISRRFLVPAITHQTKVSERSEILESLAEGKYTAVVTSKVLNEGVDVPSANVAVVISGSGSVREHVQRLGRILRRQEGKRAILYELVSANTSEASMSERRREHTAFAARPTGSRADG